MPDSTAISDTPAHAKDAPVRANDALAHVDCVDSGNAANASFDPSHGDFSPFASLELAKLNSALNASAISVILIEQPFNKMMSFVILSDGWL
ncbi:hypothetical protein HT585_25720 [Ensifer sp. HO-A22]|uniref:Uncharacterized protein n=1 Tax=Ensifer oleiphilus TaxID=2742698 RepID=A0A7Y6QAV5_9HYPH|nr:hypothetical protein [Ensifer oleiphilus]NVD42275.1 hypothetical protein [Ensifer oleiphilus]